jgi:hypothetical protein
VIDAAVDRWDAFAERYRVPLAVLSIAWFAASCAEYAGFIDLPIPALLPLSGWLAILPAALWNGVWWGVAYPRIDARCKARNPVEEAHG